LEDNLNRAAQIMWENNCGAVPVVDEKLRIRGMITDRDISIAAYFRGLPLREIAVGDVCRGRQVDVCGRNESLEVAEGIMQRARVRRLPVVDADGQVCGVIALGDIAQRASGSRGKDSLSYEGVAKTLAAVSRPSNDAFVGVL